MGRVKDAGAVHLLVSRYHEASYTNDLDFRPRRNLTQDSERVPGGSEPGDVFGAALAWVDYCPPQHELSKAGVSFLVGAPGEDLGQVGDAGAVTLYDSGIGELGRAVAACPSQLIRQDGLAAGHAEAGDRLGDQLYTHNTFDTREVLIAVPGEDVGTVADASGRP